MNQKKKHKKQSLFIASDHAGFLLKKFLITNNPEQNWKDLGTHSSQKTDYPQYAQSLCRKIQQKGMGVLICGTGMGMAMAAGRFKGIRAANAWNTKAARLAREHNNANVLCLGARLLSKKVALQILKTFIKSKFKKGRHLKRIKQIEQKE